MATWCRAPVTDGHEWMPGASRDAREFTLDQGFDRLPYLGMALKRQFVGASPAEGMPPFVPGGVLAAHATVRRA